MKLITFIFLTLSPLLLFANDMEILATCSKGFPEKNSMFEISVLWHQGKKDHVKEIRFNDILSSVQFSVPYFLKLSRGTHGSVFDGFYLHSGIMRPKVITFNQNAPILEVTFLPDADDATKMRILGHDYSGEKNDFEYIDCKVDSALMDKLSALPNATETSPEKGLRKVNLK